MREPEEVTDQPPLTHLNRYNRTYCGRVLGPGEKLAATVPELKAAERPCKACLWKLDANNTNNQRGRRWR